MFSRFCVCVRSHRYALQGNHHLWCFESPTIKGTKIQCMRNSSPCCHMTLGERARFPRNIRKMLRGQSMEDMHPWYKACSIGGFCCVQAMESMSFRAFRNGQDWCVIKINYSRLIKCLSISVRRLAVVGVLQIPSVLRHLFVQTEPHHF